MKLFAESAFAYLRRQVDEETDHGFLFVMPSLPPIVVKDVADRVTALYCERPEFSPPVIKVAAPLFDEWEASADANVRNLAEELSGKGCRDVRQNLTYYRNTVAETANRTVVLLVGIDRVTDSASMADFHHVDLGTIWERELGYSFEEWTRAVLDMHVGYEPETLNHFDLVLVPLVERGLADVLQVSRLLGTLGLSGAQDGRDAEKVLLTSLAELGLPEFSTFDFSKSRGFGAYLDSAVAFFSYDSFLDEKKRDRAVKTIESFVRDNGTESLDPSVIHSFDTGRAFFDALTCYVRNNDRSLRDRLLACDFVTVSDRILGYEPPRSPARKRQVTKLTGDPIEVVLSALWSTLRDFKRTANEAGFFANEVISGIRIESQLFKHDCDGASAEECQQRALAYLGRLLGGVDRFIENCLDVSRWSIDERAVSLHCELLRQGVNCQLARTSEPLLQFMVVVQSSGWDQAVKREFEWRLPEIHPHRVATEVVQWAANALSQHEGYSLPVFHIPYYQELLLAKDDEEVRRVLLRCVQDESEGAKNLLEVVDLDRDDPLLPDVQRLAFEYGRFVQRAAKSGIYAGLLDEWDDLRKAYDQACGSYLTEPACRDSSLAAMLFRSFLIIARRPPLEGDRWVWQTFEPSCAVTVLHPAVLEMLQAHSHYLLAAFSTVAGRELASPGARRFSDAVWEGLIDLSAIQMPLSGLLMDQNLVLDTDVRGNGLIHRVGSVSDTEAPLTTRLLLRYDTFDEDDVADADLFRSSRESVLIRHIFSDYRKLYPHAEDGLSIAVYRNQDIQPVIAGVNEYLKDVCIDRADKAGLYAMSVTVFTESSDDSSVAQWLDQWKERWEAAETQASLAHYRRARLSVAHRIISSEDNYRQFAELVRRGLDVDIAILNGFIRAGSKGNSFELVEPYDVTSRTLKFPILEKSFCSFADPGKTLQRARVLSNRQFRVPTQHAEVMARLKSRETPQNTHHVVLGYGDYEPWQGVVDELHQRAEWVVCIDPNVDERLLAQKTRSVGESRDIIGFGSGVGTHGESNYTISTEQFRLSDVLSKLTASIQQLFVGWTPHTYQTVAQCVLAQSRHLSGLSLVRATGIGEYIRDFMAYSLTSMLLKVEEDVLCHQLVSLDAYRHWFDSAESNMRPDLLWVVVRINEQGRLHLDMRLIECKLACLSDAHLQKAREQLERGLHHLASLFLPRSSELRLEDERPDQRFWWLQLHRLIASKAEGIAGRERGRVLSALERLSEGDYEIEWRASAVTFWTDQTSSAISLSEDEWLCSVEGQEVDIGVVSSGTEFVRALCERGEPFLIPWKDGFATFRAETTAIDAGLSDGSGDEPGEDDGASGASGSSGDVPPGLGGAPSIVGTPDSATDRATRIPDRILLGVTSPGSRNVYWEFGHKELSNRHMLIFGSSGMGKTYTIQCLLSELGLAGQNSLIVDYTNGFFDNQLEPEVRSQLQPQQHIVVKTPLAINPFRQQAEHIGEEVLPESASATAQRVSGVFSEVYNFGDQQKSALYQAVKAGLEGSGGRMTLADLIPQLEELVEQKGVVGQSAGSVSSKIRPFVDQNPFGMEDPESWERIFTDPTHRCHIVQLAGFMKDAARLVTEFSLIDLYWFYRSRGTQHRPRVIVLDEVQNLDHRDESPLAQLLREGRKFGFALILATQIMSNLDKDERDRLFNAAHKLFFRPADTEIRSYADIAAVTTGEKADVWMKRLADLRKGECYSLGPSLNEATGKLEVKAFRIHITPLSERSAVA